MYSSIGFDANIKYEISQYPKIGSVRIRNSVRVLGQSVSIET